MARRTNHEGTIYQRPDGRWAAGLSVNGKRRWVYGKTRAEVAERLRQLQGLAQRAGFLPDPGRQTLGDYLTTWLEQAAQRLRPKTLANYRGIIERLIIPHLGKVKLSKLNGLALATFLAQLSKQGVSAFRLRQTYALLHKALGDAVRWGLLPHNPAATIERPRPKPAERHIWTPDQVATFLAAIEAGQGGQYGDLFAFLLASGCRIGEALGLGWRDVDAGTVRIERQITEVSGRPIEGRPKSEAGVRTIVLPGWGLAALERQRARVRQWQIKSGCPFAAQWQRVFPTERGTVPEATNLRRAFRRLCEMLDLPPIRLHDLRHTSLTLLAAQGVPVKDLQRRAGHSSATVTLEVYLHAAEDGDRKAAQVLEAITGKTR